jgi:hypothetical protein
MWAMGQYTTRCHRVMKMHSAEKLTLRADTYGRCQMDCSIWRESAYGERQGLHAADVLRLLQALHAGSKNAQSCGARILWWCAPLTGLPRSR